MTDDSSSVLYYNVNTGKYYSMYSASYVEPEDNDRYSGAGHAIQMSKSDNYYYAKEGYGTFELESDTNAKKEFDAYVAYGHTRTFFFSKCW